MSDIDKLKQSSGPWGEDGIALYDTPEVEGWYAAQSMDPKPTCGPGRSTKQRGEA